MEFSDFLSDPELKGHVHSGGPHRVLNDMFQEHNQ
jgi:hypothetical protein